MDSLTFRSRARYPKTHNFLPALAIALMCFSVYLITLAPGLTVQNWGQDGGDWITAAHLGRVAHPPGAPLYWLMTRIFILLPVGTPAWRMNVFSALCATLTIVVLFKTLWTFGFNRWISAAGALSVGVSFLFWSQALITEVYALAALCVSLVVLVQAQDAFSSQHRAFLTGLLTGLAGSVHLTTLVMVIAGFPKGFTRQLRYTMGVVLGLSLYAVFFLVRPCNQVWGEVCTLSGWWHYVSARMYAGYGFNLHMDALFVRIVALFGEWSRLFTPLGAFVMVIGLWRLYKYPASKAASIRLPGARVVKYGMVILIISLYALLYDTPDSIVYLVPTLPLMGIFLALGLMTIASKAVPAWLSMVFPLLLILLNWTGVSLAGETSVATWQSEALAQFPQHALVVTQQGRYTFELWYSVLVEPERADVVVVDEGLWQYPWYRTYLRQTYSDMSCTEDVRQTIRPVCLVKIENVICE